MEGLVLQRGQGLRATLRILIFGKLEVRSGPRAVIFNWSGRGNWIFGSGLG
jgi:hypothetical protein